MDSNGPLSIFQVFLCAEGPRRGHGRLWGNSRCVVTAGDDVTSVWEGTLWPFELSLVQKMTRGGGVDCDGLPTPVGVTIVQSMTCALGRQGALTPFGVSLLQSTTHAEHSDRAVTPVGCLCRG